MKAGIDNKNFKGAAVLAAASSRYALFGSLAGLAGGMLIGAAIHANPAGSWRWLLSPAEVLGSLWVNMLQVLALPLSLAAIISAVASRSNLKTAGRITAGALILFFVFLTVGGAYSALISPVAVGRLHIDTQALTSIDLAKFDPASQGNAPARFSFGSFLASLIPRNIVKSALDLELLPLLVLSMLFGFALRRTGSEGGMAVIRVIEGITETLLLLVGWAIRFSPFGIFALSLTFAAGLGLDLSAVLAKYILLVSSLLLLFNLLMYPAVWLFAGIGPRKFAGAILPSQIMAASTRSSLACLPAMLEAGEKKLRLNPAVVRITLPLTVSLFKLNHTISATARLFFVAALFGIPLSGSQVFVFLLSVMLLSQAYPGLPGTGSPLRTLPAYLAAGMPIEGILLLESVEIVVDVFKTMLNVTADLSVTAILSRYFVMAEESGAEPVARLAERKAVDRIFEEKIRVESR